MKKKENSLKRGGIYFVEYLDASYTYKTVLSEEEFIPQKVSSIGFLKDFNEDYINLGLVKKKKSNEYSEGLVIPKKTILKINLLKNK